MRMGRQNRGALYGRLGLLALAAVFAAMAAFPDRREKTPFDGISVGGGAKSPTFYVAL